MRKLDGLQAHAVRVRHCTRARQGGQQQGSATAVVWPASTQCNCWLAAAGPHFPANRLFAAALTKAAAVVGVHQEGRGPAAQQRACGGAGCASNVRYSERCRRGCGAAACWLAHGSCSSQACCGAAAAPAQHRQQAAAPDGGSWRQQRRRTSPPARCAALGSESASHPAVRPLRRLRRGQEGASRRWRGGSAAKLPVAAPRPPRT